ncbi:MAG TPA: GTPase Era [Thermoanaerobaculia bacterium]
MKVGEVAVVGRPNAGKSTLVNALVGEKVAIVSDKPQTTRRRILGVARLPGAEIALIDTPGIHRPQYKMNAAMVREATDSLASADIVLLVVDATEPPGPGLAFILERLKEVQAETPAILAVNKIDRLRKDRLLPMLDDLSKRHAFREIVPVSAKTGDGVERLSAVLAANLPEGEPGYPEDFLTATPETEWIAEVIREKLLERTRDELPFAHAVVIESVKPAEGKDLTVVRASIVVEREGQKGIVVGKGGSMIREIGKAAREELEAELSRRLYLELTVRVEPDWRNDEAFLSRLRGGTQRS